MARTSLRAATAEVARRDRAMARLIERVGPVRLPRPVGDPFQALAESILYQQLAGAAAAAIHRRFLALFDGDLTPHAVLAMPEQRIRAAGLSGAKAASIRDLALKVVDGTVPLERLRRLPDDRIVERLSTVRGIGRWTAEMFLIFELRRLDVWPVEDYGVRQGWALAYGLDAPPPPRALQAEADRFRPYRTIPSWYCWQAVRLSRAGTAAADRERRSRR